MIVDGEVNILPADARNAIAAVTGDAMRWSGDASELLDVQMQQVAGSMVLVALYFGLWLKVAYSA